MIAERLGELGMIDIFFLNKYQTKKFKNIKKNLRGVFRELYDCVKN